MKIINKYLTFCILLAALTLSAFSQRQISSAKNITASDLEAYVTFLSSPLLKGRMNGEEGLDIAANYIASQAKLLGLKPANNNSYFQPYNIVSKKMNMEKTMIQIVSDSQDTTTLQKPMYQLLPTGPSDFVIEGEVVFAGYGIKADKYKYNDLENLITQDKILLVMDRAPMEEDGKTTLFEEAVWSSNMSFQIKLTTLLFSKAKAILIVADPKSGFQSMENSNPGFAGYLNTMVSLKNSQEQAPNPFMSAMPKVIFIHREVADAILKDSGFSLEDLQNTIDNTRMPYSFNITGKKLKITEASYSEDRILNNVCAYIEGSDPDLKKEVIVFSSHYDHIGGSGDKINTGADDDASGCAALLSMAEAFQSLKKKPLRSILFLWVSGEEVGLLGSESYVENPLFPIENTVVDLNMDMIGRVKGIADTTDQTPMTGPNSVFVITDNQSKDLQSIADDIDKKSLLDFDYSLSGNDHPLQLFSRSDHYNFVKKDIPVLFFSTGIHTDYHTPGDVVEKIDFRKMEMITRAMYEIGLTVSNRKTRITNDNPYSSWEINK